jgi:L-alanine-DL-glutamate epimerase and related enzymes of enolase superfamily
MDRRSALKLFGAAAPAVAAAQTTRGVAPLKITDVKTIMTQPAGDQLVIVKVLTSEPGLYGIGCATHKERPLAVAAAINDYLKPFVIGKNPEDIEDIWQSAYVSPISDRAWF